MKVKVDVLQVLCAGAVKGLVTTLLPRFHDETGATLDTTFGAVGAMKEALLAGAPCDVMIVTDAMVRSLQADELLRADSLAPLGRVRTGIAVRTGEALPDVSTPDALKARLLAAGAVFFPDPERATAGIHFASVLDRLGVREALAPRLRTFPNGATAMRELAADRTAGAIGCTQITEILYTPGTALAGALPEAFELATVYSAAISMRAKHPGLGQHFIDLLCGEDTRALRAAGGFEFE